MKKYFLFAVLVYSNLLLQAQDSIVVPAEVRQFILKGFQALDYVKGDINKDGKADAVLILKNTEEGTDGDMLRPILLLVRNEAGQLEQKQRNDSFIMCKGCGGIFGDPYAGTRIYKDIIEVSFYGGSAWRWGETYYFSFNKKLQYWDLILQQQTSYHNGNPKQTNDITIKADELKGQTLSTVNYLNDGTEKTFGVIANKTFFYTNPDLKTKPRKAYLVKTDTFKAYRATVNFVKVEFLNSRQQVSSGYILKKHLRRID